MSGAYDGNVSIRHLRAAEAPPIGGVPNHWMPQRSPTADEIEPGSARFRITKPRVVMWAVIKGGREP